MSAFTKTASRFLSARLIGAAFLVLAFAGGPSSAHAADILVGSTYIGGWALGYNDLINEINYAQQVYTTGGYASMPANQPWPNSNYGWYQLQGNGGSYFTLNGTNIGSTVTVIHPWNDWIEVSSTLCKPTPVVTVTTTGSGDATQTFYSYTVDMTGCNIVAQWGRYNQTLSLYRIPPPTSSVAVSPNPVPYGGTPVFTLSSSNAIYCYVYVDSLPIAQGYITSGNYTNGVYAPGSHTASSYCYNSAWAGSGWSSTPFTVNPASVNGTCAATHYNCSAGTSINNNPNSASAWTWSCAGSNGGTTASCSEVKTYTITASAGIGGTISPSGTQTVAYGGSQSYTIAPSAGYVISSVTVDGMSKGAIGTYTFSNVTGSHSISASFSVLPPTTGTVVLSPNLSSAPWTVSGCTSQTGTGSRTLSGVPAGNCTVTWGAVGGYTTPPSAAQYLSGGGTVQFPATYNPAPLPDLIAGQAAPTTSLFTGVPAAFSATIQNIGNASTGTSFPNFFQVATVPNGGGTVTDLAPTTLGALPQGGISPVTSPSYTFSTPGMYSIRACANKSSSAGGVTVAESNSNNNCSPSWTNVSVAQSCAQNQGSQCTSAGNACGQTNQGTVLCNGSCSAPTPPNSSCPLPTSSVSISQNPVPYGGNPGFTLSSTNAYYCYVQVDWNNLPGTPGYFTSGTFYHGPFTAIGQHQAESYCYNAAWMGSGWSTTNFTVSAPVPTATLSANPSVLTGQGNTKTQWVGSTNLTWGSTNTTSCTGSNFSTGGATQGSVAVPISFTTVYGVTCQGLPGSSPASASYSALVTVNYPAASVSLSASPKTVRLNSTTQLSWSASSVKSNTCTITRQGGGWSQSLANAPSDSGTVTSPSITGQTAFTLSCSGLDGTTSSTATVSVGLVPTVKEI